MIRLVGGRCRSASGATSAVSPECWPADIFL